MVFATRYHKIDSISRDVKITHRYLPCKVGELVVWYMWLMLPFHQWLEAIVWEKGSMSSHIWPTDPSGRKWTSDRLSEALKRESKIGLGKELPLQHTARLQLEPAEGFCALATPFVE
jgi:hypothetical protein